MKHRPENQCVGCLRTDQKLEITIMGFICKDCCIKQRIPILSGGGKTSRP